MRDHFPYIDYAAATDPGLVRHHNEDSILCLPEFGVFAVADGVGGAAGGEFASKTLVEQIKASMRSAKRANSLENKGAQIVASVDTAEDMIIDRCDQTGQTGTATTIVMIILDDEDPGQALIMHAGDSRAYLLRQKKLQQITTDHSIVELTGVRHKSELPDLYRNMITRAIGLKENEGLETAPFEFREGDVLLLCSDGLTGMVPDSRIEKKLSSLNSKNLESTTHDLVKEANKAGGIDNISAVLIRFGRFSQKSNGIPPAASALATIPRFQAVLAIGVIIAFVIAAIVWHSPSPNEVNTPVPPATGISSSEGASE